MRALTLDAKKTFKGNFKPSSRAESDFYRQLKKVAELSGFIIDQFKEGVSITNPQALQKALKDYSESLTPWAFRQASKFLKQVENSNQRAYQKKSKAIGKAIDLGLGDKNVVAVAQALLHEQVGLIKSIPLEAGLRAQRIAFQAVLEGTRAMPDSETIKQLEKELDASTEVATRRALLIARTETARSNAAMNQSRATALGSTQYRWHNSGDAAVRHSHKVYKGRPLQGMIFSWDNPPTLSDGMTGHPGTFPNCRCFAEPVFDDE